MAELWLALRYYKEKKARTISTRFHYRVENGKDYHLKMAGELFLLSLLLKYFCALNSKEFGQNKDTMQASNSDIFTYCSSTKIIKLRCPR